MYELAADSAHHDHLYCLRCGVIIEFEEDRIEKLQVKVCHKEDFRPFRHTLRITGLCKKCTTRQE